MSERVNYAYFSQKETLLLGARWGGNSIWEYIIQGVEYSEHTIKRIGEREYRLEAGCDGAILIDATQKNVIFDARACSPPSFKKCLTEEEENKYWKLDHKISYFYNVQQNELNPIFVDFLIRFARVSWEGWNVYFARYYDFLEQLKIERDITKIESLNYHKTHVHKPYPDYPHEDFPFISEEEILWFLKIHFYDSANSNHWCAIANIDEFERGLYE